MNVLGVMYHTLVPGLIFLASAIVAWRSEKVGGSILIVEGLAVSLLYPIIFRNMASPTVFFVLLTMALPPLVAGILFLIDWRKSRVQVPA